MAKHFVQLILDSKNITNPKEHRLDIIETLKWNLEGLWHVWVNSDDTGYTDFRGIEVDFQMSTPVAFNDNMSELVMHCNMHGKYITTIKYNDEITEYPIDDKISNKMLINIIQDLSSQLSKETLFDMVKDLGSQNISSDKLKVIVHKV